MSKKEKKVESFGEDVSKIVNTSRVGEKCIYNKKEKKSKKKLCLKK